MMKIGLLDGGDGRSKHSPKVGFQVVRWAKPQVVWAKLNIDGSARSSPGPSGGAGICRNLGGDLIFAFSMGFGVGSSNRAELHSVWQCLSMRRSPGLSKVVVESDSSFVVDLVNRTAIPSWAWDHWRKRIDEITISGSFSFSHIPREVNGPTDGLARLASATQGNSAYFVWADLPRDIKGLVLLDKTRLGAVKEIP
ncbi:uncharacterized protein LOC131226923 [Magnolia sinica]|uniref:uncharacterized protein LOC131226923 n=1 Tax=Magnolia sinica TaxID=86752 RepID=UPI002657ED74|nr:uncharacterized protein LOC131226923 [Magnolia sinica]